MGRVSRVSVRRYQLIINIGFGAALFILFLSLRYGLSLRGASRLLAGEVLPPSRGVAAPGLIDEPKTPANQPENHDEGEATTEVHKGPFEIELKLKGHFVSASVHQIRIDPKAWMNSEKILSVLPHGTKVRKGDVLLQLETKKLEEAIEESQLDLAIAEQTLANAELEFPFFEKMAPLDIEAAKRAKKYAEEELEHFLKVDRALSEESARFTLKTSEDNLKYNREELKQLEQMYKDKDLTEETEEMVLQRTRAGVEAAEFYLRSNRINTEQTLKKDIPRKEIEVRDLATRASLSLEKTLRDFAIQREQKRLALLKQRKNIIQAQRKHKDMAQDLESLTVLAPADGILYYGHEHNGTWTTGALAGKLVAGSSLAPSEVELTVVAPEATTFQANVDENQIHLLSVGLKGYLVPTAFPTAEMVVTLSEFSPVPKDGHFEARFAVTRTATDPSVFPTMTGEATLPIYRAETALSVPQTGVFRDVNSSRYVYLMKKIDGSAQLRPEKRAVKVGRSNDGKVEILEGLSEGDRVRTSKP